MSHLFPSFFEENTYRDPKIFFPQVLHESQAPHNGKGQQAGDRAFRCGYKGCGRLYTTAHHLKVRWLQRALSLAVFQQAVILPSRFDCNWSLTSGCSLPPGRKRCVYSSVSGGRDSREGSQGRLPGGGTSAEEGAK